MVLRKSSCRSHYSTNKHICIFNNFDLDEYDANDNDNDNDDMWQKGEAWVRSRCRSCVSSNPTNCPAPLVAALVEALLVVVLVALIEALLVVILK